MIKFARTILPVAALLIGVALLQAGSGLQGTLLPLRAESVGFSTFSISLLGSMYFLGFIGGCLYGPRLIAQVGHIRVFTAMAAIASMTSLVHGLFLIPMPWWLLRVLTGFCFSVLFIVIESWLNERSTKETRGSIFAVYLVINMTVLTLGQMTLTVFSIDTFTLFALTSILISMAAVPVALSSSPAPVQPQATKIDLIGVYKISPVGVVGCLVVGIVHGSFWALGTVFAGHLGLSVPDIAIFMSVVVIAGAIGQFPIGIISDVRDRRLVMLVVSLIAIMSGVGLWVMSKSIGYQLYIACAIWGFSTFPLYGLAVAHANDYAKPDQFVKVSSALLLIYALGAIIGPITAGILMSFKDASYLFIFTASVQTVLLIFILWRLGIRDAAPQEEQLDYIDALVATQSASTSMEESIQEDMVGAMEETLKK